MQMVAHYFPQVDRRKDIGVVYQKGAVVIEKPGCLFDATTGIEQLCPFIRKCNADTKLVVCFHKVDDLISEVMDIDDDLVEACSNQSFNGMLQQGLTTYRHQCFRHGVGKGFETGAETGGEDHCFHVMGDVRMNQTEKRGSCLKTDIIFNSSF